MREFIKKLLSGENNNKFELYIRNVSILFSQNINVIFFGGDPDETLSSRTGKAQICGKWFAVNILAPFINWLFMDQEHCKNAIEYDEGKYSLWDWSK